MSIRVSTKWDQRLHYAAARGDAGEIRRVLDTGRVHVDCIDREGTTPLIVSSANGQFECVRELLEQGADPSMKRSTGTGALFFAAQGGFMDILQILLKSGAPINQASKDGGTALIVSSQYGHLDIVLELLKRRANTRMAMRDGATALFVAAQNGHTAIIRALLDHGANVNERRMDGSSPLWIASQMGHSPAVSVLLARCADVRLARYDGATALFKAAHKGHVDVVRELLAYKPRLGMLKNGETALHAASFHGHSEIVKLLLSAGSDPILKNDQGLSPFQIASKAGHLIVEQFIREAAKKRWENSQRLAMYSRRSCSSSRNSSLETIVETSPILGRSENDILEPNRNRFASCELTDTNEVVLTAPSPSPSVVSEPMVNLTKSNSLRGSHRLPSQSHSDLSSVKTFFQWTLSSFRKAGLSKKQLHLKQH